METRDLRGNRCWRDEDDNIYGMRDKQQLEGQQKDQGKVIDLLLTRFS